MRDVRPRAKELLAMLGLTAREDHRPASSPAASNSALPLPGLMNEPGLVLADEPTGNLDIRTAERLHDEIVRLSRDLGQTFVIVTHNPALAERRRSRAAPPGRPRSETNGTMLIRTTKHLPKYDRRISTTHRALRMVPAVNEMIALEALDLSTGTSATRWTRRSTSSPRSIV
jgi:hypothetical protein